MIFDRILQRKEFEQAPPVLLDLGASGQLNKKWKYIAKYCICIAFDADEREIDYTIKESSHFRKLYVSNKIVVDKSTGKGDFYLTKLPFCSSTLEPDMDSLQEWVFSDYFDVQKKIELETIDLSSVFKELKIEKVDWFKADTQGTDLRLFESMDEKVINKVIAAEFEPGILDSYKGEDKLYKLLSAMERFPFWMTNAEIRGSQRMNKRIYNNELNKIEKKFIHLLLKEAPGWAEITYINDFKNAELLNIRDFLLGWIFTVIEKQYGFALELALKGFETFNDTIFLELKRWILNKIRFNYWKIFFYIIKKLPIKFFSMFLNK